MTVSRKAWIAIGVLALVAAIAVRALVASGGGSAGGAYPRGPARLPPTRTRAPRVSAALADDSGATLGQAKFPGVIALGVMMLAGAALGFLLGAWLV